MIIYLKNISNSLYIVRDLSITILPNIVFNASSIPDNRLQESNDLLYAVSVGNLVINDGVKDFSTVNGIRYLLGQVVEPRDWTGKLFYHHTVRPLGTKVHFTGAGDNAEDPFDIGQGTDLEYEHKIGDPLISTVYLDFNTINNITHIQEGYLQWIDAYFDKVTVVFVPRVATYEPAANTPYYLDPLTPIILPSAIVGGAGNVNISSYENALLQSLPDENGNRPEAYWNADYNSITGLFENLTPVIDGTGDYNIFHIEYPIARFANRIGMLGSHVLHFDTDDTDIIRHGSRLKATFETKNADHNWAALINLKMHRTKSC